jgi:2-methylcitrate dehydratase
MHRAARTEPSLREERRRFLKQIAAVSVIAGAGTMPAIAQDSTDPRGSILGVGQTPLADALARYAIALKYEDLPEELVRSAKRTILDTIGCAFGGYTAGPSRSFQPI